MLRRANSEAEARKIFAQAEAALDTEQPTPVGADVRASRTIRTLGEEYIEDSIERGKQPRTMEGRESRLNAHILPTIGDVPVTKWRVEHSRKVMEKGSQDDPLPARPRGPARPAGGDAQARLAPRLARPQHRSARRSGDRPRDRAARSDDAVRRSAPAPGDPSGEGDGRRRRQAVRTRGHRPADDTPAAVRHQDPRRRLRRPAPRRAERAPRDRRLLRPRLRPRQRLAGSRRARQPASAAR